MFKSYFNGKILLNSGAMICLALSDRSDGKTFDCKVRALEDYRDKGKITVYLRRYKTEITKQMYETFFNEVIEKEQYSEFKDWEFKGTKQGIKVKLPEFDIWDWIVYFVPLTMSGKLKSQLDISRIQMIDYDEFVPLDGIYLKDEITLLLEFYKSVDRDRETTQIMICGNKISPFNPLFDYFGIDLDITNNKIRTYRDNTIAVQIYGSKEHRETRAKGKFAKLVENTSYEDYSSGGILNALNLKIKSHKNCEYIWSFLTSKGEGTLWTDENNNFIVSTTKRKDGIIITDKMYNIEREQLNIAHINLKKVLQAMYNTGSIYFESEKAFHLFEDILKKVGTR